MSLWSFSVHRWQFTLVVFALLIATGLWALGAIPRAEDPSLKFPGSLVQVRYPGADPEDVERLVVDPIEDALAELDRSHREEGTAQIASRDAVSASLGNAGWAGLEPGARYLFTIEAVRRLVANRDQVLSATRWSPGRGIALMWQTLLNGLTFGRNVALGALGRAESVPAARPWQRAIDAGISILAALPALLIAIPLELAAAAVKRGSAVKLSFKLL